MYKRDEIIYDRERLGTRSEKFKKKETSTFMEMIRLPSEREFDRLHLTKWNIRQPPPEVEWPEAIESGGLDIMICPGVAFTRRGHRLGHGMGYYDRYIARLSGSAREPMLIGVAFDEQILEDIPCDETDVLLDKVITSEAPERQ
ncbi:probable 5-formyltetrahydrofolate cyclo-ligase [Galendromus occidentalis]|uniref:5-formyltetrahydrofolate cyclo-ligase n=1 Tax=Galendromus occidentalis TaxID=34638 RepID=A0AAJ6VWZ6_9ACAR|nr:probable 5-formyltetrahydrofolate cyclo-ligase [Galendromus occidentalis]